MFTRVKLNNIQTYFIASQSVSHAQVCHQLLYLARQNEKSKVLGITAQYVLFQALNEVEFLCLDEADELLTPNFKVWCMIQFWIDLPLRSGTNSITEVS